MKKIILLIAIFLQTGLISFARPTDDSTGLPGDHFDLYAMLDLFKASTSPEDFEKRLNTESNHVNNLDLNGDGKVDYIRVIDYTEKTAHAIVLRVPVNETESQDVAVIQIEMKGDNSAQLQVVGDELLYGKDYIIEPGAKKDSTSTEKKLIGFNEQTFVFVNVWYWPCVTYIYYPTYIVWVSPWYWMYWPGWWHPWHPVMWIVYYDWVYPYHMYYYPAHHHYMNDANTVYQPRRVVSTTVTTTTSSARKNYEQKKSTPSKPEENSPRPTQTKNPAAPTPQPSPSQKPSGQTPKPKAQPSPQPVPKSPQPAPVPKAQPAPVPKGRPK